MARHRTPQQKAVARERQNLGPATSKPQLTTVNGQIRPETYGGSTVTLFSNDPKIVLKARLRGPVSRPLPRPKIETVDRRSRVGLTQWAGRDPYVMVVPISLDGYPDGPVEQAIDVLAGLAMRHKGDDGTPVVQVSGPVPFPTGLKSPKWRISDLQEVAERTIYNAEGKCSRLAVDVTLTEHVTDRLFVDSADDSESTGFGKGIRNKRVPIRKGETFYDVAQHVFHDRSRAKDIARANGIRLGWRAPKDTTVRVP